ncbi:hypothetical protein LBMAG27_19960 [Bacteroidota bacterium]|nr:hypothetical protein LBMAG27_19960 [Bacteroidota bacterium]
MPLIFHLQKEEYELAAWKIDEDHSFFESRLQLSEEEKKFLQNIKALNKRLQWLASRHLIRVLLKTDLFIDSNYKQRGKPELLSHKKEISISHTDDVCAVIMSENKKVGIDIEPEYRDVTVIAHKYISEAEKLNREFTNEQNLFIWCAKEALFKLYAKGEVSFQNDLFVQLPELKTEGTAQTEIRKPDMNCTVTLQYNYLEDGYLLCWCCL